jgi:hypothetical protein
MNEEIMLESKPGKEKKPARRKSEKKQRKNNFNILDALIIVAVLALITVTVLVYSPTEILNLNSDNTTVMYSVCISGVSANYAASVKVGDTVSDADGHKLGIVASDVEIEPHAVYKYQTDESGNGSIVKITHPELVDIIITVTATAEKSDVGFTVDGMRIAIEAEYELVFPGFESKGVCISLSEEIAKDGGAAK